MRRAHELGAGHGPAPALRCASIFRLPAPHPLQARKRSHKEALLKEMKEGGDPELGRVAPPGGAAGYVPGRAQQQQQQQQQRPGLLQHLGFRAALSQAPAPTAGQRAEVAVGASTATLLAGGDKLSQTARCAVRGAAPACHS